MTKRSDKATKISTNSTVKQAYWRGRTWTIRAVKAGEWADKLLGGGDKVAALHSGQGLIIYRAEVDRDLAIMAVLHEAGHELFPEWETEPSDRAASEIGVFERDVKAFLEAFGVDLSPLVK
jgi:hypothetical protein